MVFVVLLSLIFIRPLISSLAFPYLNSLYYVFFLLFSIIWIISKGIPGKKIGVLKYPLTLFLAALIISTTISPNKLISLGELSNYVFGIFLFLICASLTEKHKLRVIRILTLSGLAISLSAIYQYFFGFRHILEYLTYNNISVSPFAIEYIQQKRVFFPFITPNILGGYLAMIIPLTLISRNRIWLIIPLSFALLLTRSLGAFLSILLAGIIYFYLQGKFKKWGVIFLVGLLALIVMAFIIRSTVPREHIQPLFSMSMRIYYWKGALGIIRAKPLLGVGLGMLGNFSLMDSRYAHNSYLQIWAEMGILGIISWLWIIFTSLKVGVERLKENNPQQHPLTIALLAASSAFLIHNFIDFSFFLPEVSIVWWVILGLIVSKDNGESYYKV